MARNLQIGNVIKNDWDRLKTTINRIKLKLGPDSTPEFQTITFNGLTASRLVSTDANKKLSSVANLASWIAGTTNQVNVADDGDGTITLSLPQDYDTGATPTLGGLTIVNAITEFSTDGTLADDSDSALPTEKAVKTYVDTAVALYNDLEEILDNTILDGGTADVSLDGDTVFDGGVGAL